MPLYDFAFALTGMGTALLGSTLPATLHDGHLTDSRGGLLLLAAWGGSTGGALLARGRVDRSAAAGLALSAAALWGMSLHHPAALLSLYGLYGVGLGTTMTSISLLRSRGVSAAAAGIALNRLNLFWALGACAAPLLALRSLRLLSVSSLFQFAGAVFALSAFLILAFAQLRAFSPTTSRHAPAAERPESPRPALPWAPLRFCLFAAASVGLESAIGSWLTTYTERSTLAVGTAVSANAAFWIGLLLSRAMHSLPNLRWVLTRSARLAHFAAVGIAHVLWLTHPTPSMLASAGLLCGWGLGPLYPLVLSVALPRYRSTVVFVLAGVGASLVPWLTGLLSSTFGSLRLGLLAPAFTFCLLSVAAFRMRSDLGLQQRPHP